MPNTFISTHVIVDQSLVPSCITRFKNWESFILINTTVSPNDCRLYNMFLEFLQAAALAAVAAQVAAVPLLPVSVLPSQRQILVMAHACVTNARESVNEKPSDISILHDILTIANTFCFPSAIQLKATFYNTFCYHYYMRSKGSTPINLNPLASVVLALQRRSIRASANLGSISLIRSLALA